MITRRAPGASREEEEDALEDERQLQEAIRLSMMDQEENHDQPESPAAASSSRNKRRADEDLGDGVGKRPRPRRSPTNASGSSAASGINMAFPNGAVRITRTPGRQSDKNCVNLGDLIQKDQLVSACVYSFFIAREEVFRHLPFSHSSDGVPVSGVGVDPGKDAEPIPRFTLVGTRTQTWTKWWRRQRQRPASPSVRS